MGELLSQAAFDVLAERRRQVEVEGLTPENDIDQTFGQLLDAALCYADGRQREQTFGWFEPSVPAEWPWVRTWWQPTDRRGDLVKAAALLLAEIERLDREAAR